MKTLETDTLDQEIKNSPKVLVQYGAAWCGACRLLKPKLVSLEEQNPGITFLYVDAEKLPLSREMATIENLPTIVGFKNGEFVSQVTGTNMDKIQGVIDEITRD